MATGVKEKVPMGLLGNPMSSNGVGVPRPMLTLVGSRKHREGYSDIDASVGRLGLGEMGRE